MDKQGIITIGEWQKGMATSPYYGFGSIINCEVFETPGVLKIGNSLIPKLSSLSYIPVAYLKASNGDKFVLLSNDGGNSTLYKNGVSLTNVAGQAWDMVEYKGYLIISSSIGLHAYGITTATAYFNTFKSGLTDKYYIKMIVGQDDKIYLTNGNAVATITDFVAGSFSVAPTCTLTAEALNLKDGQYAVTLEELGTKIMVGTQGGDSWSARGAQRVANIYPWNRQAGTLGNPGLADLPIKLNECGVHAMKSVNNILYVVAGTRGNVYKTDGTSSIKIGRIPWTQSRAFSTSVAFYPNAIQLNTNNNLLIGLSTYAGAVSKTGVYEMNIDGSNEIVLKHKKENAQIGVIGTNELDTIFIGWQIGNTKGLDYTIGNSYSGYNASVESQVYVVGTALAKKTFQHIDFTLGKLLTNQQGIKLYYRKNTEVDYTLIGEYTFSTIGSKIAHEDKASISDAQIIQFKVELSQDDLASPTPQWDLELLSVRVW